jgi:hypothetical protein
VIIVQISGLNISDLRIPENSFEVKCLLTRVVYEVIAPPGLP